MLLERFTLFVSNILENYLELRAIINITLRIYGVDIDNTLLLSTRRKFGNYLNIVLDSGSVNAYLR